MALRPPPGAGDFHPRLPDEPTFTNSRSAAGNTGKVRVNVSVVSVTCHQLAHTHILTHLVVNFDVNLLWYGDDAGNTIEENSSVVSLIRVH